MSRFTEPQKKAGILLSMVIVMNIATGCQLSSGDPAQGIVDNLPQDFLQETATEEEPDSVDDIKEEMIPGTDDGQELNADNDISETSEDISGEGQTGNGEGSLSFSEADDNSIEDIIDTLNTDYKKVNWGVRYTPAGMDFLLISIVPYQDEYDTYLLIALTNLSDKDITISAEGYAKGKDGQDIGDFTVFDSAIRSGNTTITSVLCDGEPTGVVHWSELQRLAENYDRSTYWESNWQFGTNDEGESALKYTLALSEYGQIGDIHALVLDADGDVIGYSRDYNMEEGTEITGCIPFYGQEPGPEAVDIAMFANPLVMAEDD